MAVIYKRISKNKVKRIETKEQIIDINELKKEINRIENRLKEIKFLEYPSNSSSEVKEAIDMWNLEREEEKRHFEELLQQKKRILKEISKI